MVGQKFGETRDGRSAKIYTLTNCNRMKAVISDYGATLVELWVPDKNGELKDVVLGYDKVSDYESGELFLGATVGRNANRIANSHFELNGQRYQLEANENKHNLHSGKDYYSKRFWEVKTILEDSITLKLISENLDQGYPGECLIEVTYTLTDKNCLNIKYHAVPKDDTIINLTNHSYFNLDGHEFGHILDHKLWIDSQYFTEIDQELIPTGKLIDISETAMDFSLKKPIGQHIDVEEEQLIRGQGYDHNWCLLGEGYKKVAIVEAAQSGIVMDIYTDMPGLQVYTGNFINNEQGKNNCCYQRRQGVCFETQYFPNAINEKEFKHPIIKKGTSYDSMTTYGFRLI